VCVCSAAPGPATGAPRVEGLGVCASLAGQAKPRSLGCATQFAPRQPLGQLQRRRRGTRRKRGFAARQVPALAATILRSCKLWLVYLALGGERARSQICDLTPPPL